LRVGSGELRREAVAVDEASGSGVGVIASSR
jgi:hypothetical protein